MTSVILKIACYLSSLVLYRMIPFPPQEFSIFARKGWHVSILLERDFFILERDDPKSQSCLALMEPIVFTSVKLCVSVDVTV